MHFLRGRPELANKIQRIKGGKGGKKTKDPDFDALQLSIKEGATPTTDRNKPAEAEKEAETDAATSSNLAPAESSQSKAESSKWFSDTPNHIKSEVNLDFDDAKELLAPIVNSTDASTYYLQQHLDWSDVNDHDLSPQAEHDKPCSALFYQHAASHRTSSLAGMPRGLSFMQETIGNPEPCFSSFVDCHQDIDQHQQAGNIFQQQQNQMQHVPTQAIDTISLGQAFPTQQHPFQYSAQTSDGGQGVDLASLYRQQQILELQIQGLKQQEQFLRLRSEQQL